MNSWFSFLDWHCMMFAKVLREIDFCPRCDLAVLFGRWPGSHNQRMANIDFFSSCFSCKFISSKHGYSKRQIAEAVWKSMPMGSNESISGLASSVKKRLLLGYRYGCR